MKFYVNLRVALNEAGRAAISRGEPRVGVVRHMGEKYKDSVTVVWDGEKTKKIIHTKFLTRG